MPIPSMTAQEMFRAAYENRYTWDREFPGYTAIVAYKSGNAVFTGQIHSNLLRLNVTL